VIRHISLAFSLTFIDFCSIIIVHYLFICKTTLDFTGPDMNKKRIAIIGSGISGLSAAWSLRHSADVSLFEAQGRFGGHSNTHVVDEGDNEVAIDTGFMVFNRPNYPLLSRLFDELGIRSYPTEMSFSVSLDAGRLEYAGTNLDTLFAQRRNLVDPAFLGMLKDIVRFNRAAKRLLASNDTGNRQSVEQFLNRLGVGPRFRNHYLYPMAAAIWSCPRDTIGAFPARSFARFFANHGLIDLVNRPTWHTLEGGSRRYVARLVSDLGSCARAAAPVVAVRRRGTSVSVHLADGQADSFDEVVLACHSDESLTLLTDARPREVAMLSSVPYQANRVVLHRDATLMPKRRRVWASWNYCDSNQRDDAESAVSVTYWMNSLQRLDTRNDYFVSLNPVREPDPRLVEKEFSYDHPMFDNRSLDLHHRLKAVQGEERIWFCGAWTGYGFHEDGIRSGIDVALRLGADLPWAEQIQASHGLFDSKPPQLAWQGA